MLRNIQFYSLEFAVQYEYMYTKCVIFFLCYITYFYFSKVLLLIIKFIFMSIVGCKYKTENTYEHFYKLLNGLT